MDSDKKKWLYPNGLGFSSSEKLDSEGNLVHKDKLAYNLDKLLQRREIKKPTLIVIDGMSGNGKTTMAVQLADYLQGRPIDFEEHLFMGGEKFIKGLRVCYEKKLVVAIYTEAGDFSKKATLTKLVRTLDRVFETFRTFNIIVIVDLPFMPKLDVGIFEKGICRMLVHCYGRDVHYGRFAVYDAERMLWLRARAIDKKVINKQKIYELVQPNFRGYFKDLEPSRSRLLDRIGSKGKVEIMDASEIASDGLMSISDLSAKLDRKHIWVRNHLTKLGIKPKKIFKGRNYYDENTLISLKAAKGIRGRRKDNAEN